jgi:hypothetical protein
MELKIVNGQVLEKELKQYRLRLHRGLIAIGGFRQYQYPISIGS